MIELYDIVKIKSTGITGTVVDVTRVNNETVYTIESNTENTPGGYGGKWKLFECKRADVEKISPP